VQLESIPERMLRMLALVGKPPSVITFWYDERL
jgi:hypothetical protein